MRYFRLTIVLLVLGFAASTFIGPSPALAASVGRRLTGMPEGPGETVCAIPSSQDTGSKGEGHPCLSEHHQGGLHGGVDKFGEGVLIKGRKVGCVL